MATSTHNPVKLVRYDAACLALARAKSVDEAAKIRTAAAAMRAYAKQAKNKQLEIDAVEIRLRAERRVGELITAQKKTTGLARGGEHGGKHSLDGSRLEPSNKRPTLAAAGIDKKLSSRAQELAAVPAQAFETLLDDWRERQQTKPRVSSNVHFSSETPEHYTPRPLVEAVVECLGAIDLDPCSNAGAPNVPAGKHFTVTDDGLSLAWFGRVYMNPPYGRAIDAWVEKLCTEFDRDAVTAAIALVPARTDTQWFRRLRDYVCCFVEGRLTFVGNDDPAPFPSAIVYLGPELGRFYHCFAEFGDIWQRIEPGMFGD